MSANEVGLRAIQSIGAVTLIVGALLFLRALAGIIKGLTE